MSLQTKIGELATRIGQEIKSLADAFNAHVHGNITNGGAIGSTPWLPVQTGPSGLLQPGSPVKVISANQTLTNNTSFQDWFLADPSFTLEPNASYTMDAVFFCNTGASNHDFEMRFANIVGGSIRWTAIGSKGLDGAMASAIRMKSANTFAVGQEVTNSNNTPGGRVVLSGVVTTGGGGGVLTPQVRQSSSSGTFVVLPGTYFRITRIA